MKKYGLTFVFAIITFQAAGAQASEKMPNVAGNPLNEIRMDIGPVFVPLFFKEFVKPLYAESSGVGFKAGYDRMLFDFLSVGADFSFIVVRAQAESFEAEISSIDASIHGRYYPWKKFFYLQGGLGLVTFNFDLEGSTGALDDFKKNFDPYTGVAGVFDLGFGWRWIIAEHFLIDASMTSGLYMGKAVSATTLFKLASGALPALTGSGFPLRFDAALAFGWAF